jgi:DNA-nicking Smr family endonuclease
MTWDWILYIIKTPVLQGGPGIMAGRGTEKRKKGGGRRRPEAERPFNPAFERALGGMLGEMKMAPPAPPPSPPPVEPRFMAEQMTDEELFAAEVADVRPSPGAPLRIPPRPAVLAPFSEEEEALSFLDAVVSGEAEFSIADTDEYIEGCVKDLDRRVLRRLKSGEFAVQGHLDLHGMTRDEARTAVAAFIRSSRQSGHRCVLIVHGRGTHSKDQVPVLKDAIRNWLSRGSLGAQVLAFASARQEDGGLGAVYVLLRK